MLPEEYKEWAEGLRLIDDVCFSEIIQDRAVCEEILRVILKDEGLTVKEVRVQSSIRLGGNRGVTLDADCTLGDGAECNIEMQRADDDDHVKRVRYNASGLTVSRTKPGTKFKDIPDVIVVYITEHDFIGCNRVMYTVRKTFDDTGITVADGLTEIFVNTEADNDGTAVAELMECFKKPDFDSEKFPKLSGGMKAFKKVEGGMSGMYSAADRIRDYAMAEGRAEGRAEGKADALIEILEDYGYPSEELREHIMRQTNLELLNRWVKLSARVNSIEEFEEKIGFKGGVLV